MQYLFLGLGYFFVGLALIGAFLPLLPTVPFLLVAGACFARSSPRMRDWLFRNKMFGPILRQYQEKGAIPITAKRKAIAVIALSMSFSAIWIWQYHWAGTLSLVLMAFCLCLWIYTRPE